MESRRVFFVAHMVSTTLLPRGFTFFLLRTGVRWNPGRQRQFLGTASEVGRTLLGFCKKKNAASQIGNPCSMGTHVSFIFIGVITYNPYFKGLKTSIFHGFWGVQRYGIYLRLVDFYCKCRLNIYQSQEDPDLGNLGWLTARCFSGHTVDGSEIPRPTRANHLLDVYNPCK